MVGYLEDKTILSNLKSNYGEKRVWRKNGFQFPWTSHQIFSMIVFLFNLTVHLTINLIHVFTGEFQGKRYSFILAVNILIWLLNIGIFFFGYLATKTDPTDPTII